MATAIYKTPQFRQNVAEWANWMTQWRLPIRMFLLTPMQTETDVAKQMALQGLGQKISIVQNDYFDKFAQFAEIIFCIMATAKQYKAFKEAWAESYAMVCQQDALQTAATNRVTKDAGIEIPSWQRLYDPMNANANTAALLAKETFLLVFCCLSIVQAFTATDDNKRFFRTQVPSNLHYVLTEAQNSKDEIREALSLVGMEDRTDIIHGAIQTTLKADVWGQKLSEVIGGQVSTLSGTFYDTVKGMHVTQLFS